MGFNGFPEEATAFLGNLATHNTREWFAENKKQYKTCVEEPAKEFMEALIPRLSELADEPVSGKIFRIYRDVRFSKDKTPYNTHVRMAFHGIETKKDNCGQKPGFFFSLEPKSVITGVGSMEFSKPSLEAYRGAVDNEKTGAVLVKLLSKYGEADGYRIDDPVLKRVPPGFPPDHPRGALLRHKAFTVWHEEALPPVLYTTRSVTHLLRRYRKMKPVFDWLNGI